MKKRDESMIAHSGVFDHRQHGEHRGLGPEGENFPNTGLNFNLLSSFSFQFHLSYVIKQ
jgi:hypothetical protein